MDLTRALLFHTREYAGLAAELTAATGCARGELEQRLFPDGERYLRVLSPVRDRDAIILCGTTSDAATLDLFDLACGLVKEGARSLTMVVPFLGYSTMERQVKSGEVVVAKTRARLLSAIPTAPNGNRIALLDLHADGVAYYFEGGLVPIHLYAKTVVLKAIAQLGGGETFAVGSVDAGRAKWVESLANDLGVAASFILKRRKSARETEVVALSHAVQGARVVIYDDMVRTGGSLLGAARAYLDAGAKDVAAVCTHGVFPEDSLKRLKDSGLITRIISTNSHPGAAAAPDGEGFLDVWSCAPVLVEFLRTLSA